MPTVVFVPQKMLYLPAFQFDDSDVRLPCSTDDLLALCKSYVENESVEPIASVSLMQNPGLLIYSLLRFRNGNGHAASRLEELIRWMDQEFFCEKIEYHSFEAAEFGVAHQNLLLKWSRKKSRKRAIRFLDGVSELNRKDSRRLIESVWSDSLELVQSDDRHSALTLTSNVDLERLPIRHFWNACGKLQRLKSSFDSDLLKSKLAAMKQLAYGASHEINNPLANIATRAQSLLTEESNASKRQLLSVIYSQAMRAHEMISDMMLFAQPPDVVYESVDLMSLIEQVVGELRHELDDQQIVVGIRQYPDVEKCDVDSTQFAVAIKALIQNSIEAIGQAGEIRVQIWKRDENTIGIAVADSGQGIKESVVGQIFDPFYSGREAGRGLGFGLSKVWRIIELHGGCVAFESDDRWASRFIIAIPIQSSVVEAPNNCRIDNAQAA